MDLSFLGPGDGAWDVILGMHVRETWIELMVG